MDSLLRKVFDKCLSITSSFEGASYGGSSGNFDGMGASAFALQWNIGQRTLQPLLMAMYQKDYIKFKNLIGDENKTQLLTDLCLAPDRETIQDFITLATIGKPFSIPQGKENIFFRGGISLRPEWINIFKVLGENFRDQQLDAAQHYFDQAIGECKKFRLDTERSISFMFDFCVQRGKGNLSDEEKEFLSIPVRPDTVDDDDRTLNWILVHDTAEIKSQWQADCRARRNCIINDGGVVHGREYDLGGEFGLTDDQILP
jgi:hypothetical protein